MKIDQSIEKLENSSARLLAILGHGSQGEIVSRMHIRQYMQRIEEIKQEIMDCYDEMEREICNVKNEIEKILLIK